MVRFIISMCLTGVVFLAGANAAWAAVLVSDDFTPDTEFGPAANHAPFYAAGAQGTETNWGKYGFSTFSANLVSTAYDSTGVLRLEANTGLGVNYNAGTETLLRVSADLSVGTVGAEPWTGENGYRYERGVGLVFYNASQAFGVGGGIENHPYTGLVLGPATDGEGNGARLFLVENGATGWPNPTQNVLISDILPSFDPNAYYRLSYDIDTTTGAISNVSFGGVVLADDAFTSTAFTGANIHRVGFTISANAAGLYGYVDNFALEAVPEPSLFALLGAGALGLLGAARRGRV